MISKTIISFTNREVLKILSDHYNKEEGRNHLFEFTDGTIVPEVHIQMTMWDKDEKTH